MQPCSSFVYSAFVTPGIHQFLIYIPERIIEVGHQEAKGQPLPSGGLKDKMVIPARLFVKSMIIDLSSFDQYLTIRSFRKPGEAKVVIKTITNVFKGWKEDTPEEID